ncbi:glycosyltransferase family A protein [Fibrobacterota bacterium]
MESAVDTGWRKVLEHDPTHESGSNGPLASIIIPFYNRSELLWETLDCVKNQTHSPLELILIDDGSEDDIASDIKASLEAFGEKWMLVRMDKNQGPGKARKLGHQLAAGKYLQFLDSDDIISPEKLKLQVGFLEDHPEVIMTYALTRYMDEGETAPEQRVLGRTDQDFNRILPHVIPRMIWQTSSCLWRSSAVSPDFWKPLYGPEDVLFDFYAGLADKPVARTPGDKVLLYKRVDESGISHGIGLNPAYQQEILKYFDYVHAECVNNKKLDSNLIRRIMDFQAQKYANKITTFLNFRRVPEVEHCIRMVREINGRFLPPDVRISLLINRIFKTYVGFTFLRKWRWVKKLTYRKIKSMFNSPR